MKYLSKKVIKGKTYYYIQYRGYSRSLGTSLPSDIKKQLIEFFLNVSVKEYQKLPSNVRTDFKFGDLKTLEDNHFLYTSFKNELFSEHYQQLLLKFIILFTYHSNRQEGSRVSRKEIEDLAESNQRKPKTKTDREILNSFEAFHYATSAKMKWNMKQIRWIHFLLLKQIDPLIAGKWKNENNTAPGNQVTSDYKDVASEMQALLSWLNEELRRGAFYPPKLALQFYSRFESIHPFLDGNGRVGRILLNAILDKFNYPYIVFFSENAGQHSEAIRQTREGRWQKMYKHFLDQAKKTDEALYSDIKTFLLKLGE